MTEQRTQWECAVHALKVAVQCHANDMMGNLNPMADGLPEEHAAHLARAVVRAAFAVATGRETLP